MVDPDEMIRRRILAAAARVPEDRQVPGPVLWDATKEVDPDLIADLVASGVRRPDHDLVDTSRYEVFFGMSPHQTLMAVAAVALMALSLLTLGRRRAQRG